MTQSENLDVRPRVLKLEEPIQGQPDLHDANHRLLLNRLFAPCDCSLTPEEIDVVNRTWEAYLQWLETEPPVES